MSLNGEHGWKSAQPTYYNCINWQADWQAHREEKLPVQTLLQADYQQQLQRRS